jgi:prepilin signal peptidase PulO-like enzyme (type II secretory pathway)
MSTAAFALRRNRLSYWSPRRIAWAMGWLIPALTAGIGIAGAWQALPFPWGTACGSTLLAMLLTVIFTDGKWKKIPNWATYPVFAWILAINLFATILVARQESAGADAAGPVEVARGLELVGPASLGAIGIWPSLLGAVCCFAAMVVLSGFLRSSGGDVKLMTVIGAFLGVQYGLLAMLLGYILAGTWSLVVCIWHFGLPRIFRGVMAWVRHLLVPKLYPRPEMPQDQILKTGVPLGAHFAIGTVLALLPVIPGIHY